jgi:hypothetical protein
VWNEAAFDTSKPLYVPTTVSVTLNSCSYYYGGSWHAYPSYTRTGLSEGKYGTLCLPFDATVEGATVFEIASTVKENNVVTGINITPVTNLVAGKGYITKATGSSFTATFSGNYTETTTDNGMLGNLNSGDMAVTTGYIIYDNKIYPVGSNNTIGQYKAYITLNNLGDEARGVNFIGFDDETTGIDFVQGEGLTANGYYNLAGQRVAQPTKGVYVVNGRKVVIK